VPGAERLQGMTVLSPRSTVHGNSGSALKGDLASYWGTWGLGLGTVDLRLRTADRGLWTVDRGLWTVDCGLWTVDRGPWTVDRGLWTKY
jgi:hypothetical protein